MIKKYTAEDEQLITENLEYALGMYDLYPQDKIIIDALRLKGLKYHIIEGILFEIKKPSYIKRIVQAKKNILWGAVLLVGLLIIRILLISLPGSESLLNGKKDGEFMFRAYFKFYREIFYIIMFLSGLRTISGIFMFFKYKKLLETVQ